MNLLLRFSRSVDAVNRFTGRTVFWLMLAMVLIGAFNAVGRYAGKHLGVDLSSNTWLELQWYLFGVVFLLGGAYTLQHNAHVRVDVLYDRLSPKARCRLNIVGHLVFLLPFCVFMVWLSWAPVADSLGRGEQSSDPGGLPRYIIKVVIPLGFVLLFFQGLSELVKQFNALRTGVAVEVPRGEDDA